MLINLWQLLATFGEWILLNQEYSLWDFFSNCQSFINISIYFISFEFKFPSHLILLTFREHCFGSHPCGSGNCNPHGYPRPGYNPHDYNYCILLVHPCLKKRMHIFNTIVVHKACNIRTVPISLKLGLTGLAEALGRTSIHVSSSALVVTSTVEASIYITNLFIK